MGTGPAISEAKLGAFRGAEKAARDWPFIAFRVSAAQRARWMQPGPRISRPVATQKEQKEESELGTVSFLHAGDTNDVLLLFLLLARNKAFPEFQVPPRPSILRPFAFPRAQENTAGVLRRKAPDKKPIKGALFSRRRRRPVRAAPGSTSQRCLRLPAARPFGLLPPATGLAPSAHLFRVPRLPPALLASFEEETPRTARPLYLSFFFKEFHPPFTVCQ